nr:wound-induced protein 1 [Ipomoea batatas]GMC84103.1 wound-induced protein 1 [Ipomoea batatas]GMC90138.1 wound-induced protein 1 [Ipomoea batatas]
MGEVENAEYPLISEAELEKQNKAIVKSLYEAMASGDTRKAAGIIGGDLEWWFHGPQKCQHMMNMLTGKSSSAAGDFKFEPRSVDAIGERVIVEGWEGAQAYWVHVWTVKDGVITQFREYFNTWLIVKELRGVSVRSSKSTVWRSHPRDIAKRTLPGLVLAIDATSPIAC